MLGILSVLSSAFALEDDYTLSLEGYYRMRSYSYRNLYIDQEEPGKFVSQRLRIQPQINYKDKAKFFFMTDIMDDVVWGDNQSLASTALFAEDPSFTGENGQQSASFQLKRAWMEVDLAVGSLRVGRQPSHWGMGLLANSGDGFDDAFGENHSGANFDRILFATKPIAVAQTIMGKAVSDIPLYFGYAFDRLVEDPLNQYYGYTCDNGPTGVIYEGEEGFDPVCDVNGDGKIDSTEVHGYTETREDDVRADQLDWTFDNDDDVNEHVFLTIYRGQNIDLAGSKADLTVGLYGINRNQAETDSKVWIVDGYVYLLWKNLYLESEVLNIKGESRAVPLLSDSETDPLYKDVNIWGYAAKAGYKTKDFYALFETGYAGGDNDVTDDYFTARAIHRDYNVGLLIYDEILRVTTYRGWQGSAAALRSNGGVYNSRYIFPVVRTSFMGNWEALVGYLKVWPDKPDGAIIQCSEADKEKGIECATYEATANEIGWEVDAAIKARLYNHVLFSVEGAYAQVTDRIKLDSVGLNTEGSFFTVQTRFAYEF
ncbi:MAG: hypothetical protein CMK59_14450 [Proteobacteria bacterium]|nr:hypothetical protein [Pseudomonadota bacterium]